MTSPVAISEPLEPGLYIVATPIGILLTYRPAPPTY